jgi:hypothetical protein
MARQNVYLKGCDIPDEVGKGSVGAMQETLKIAGNVLTAAMLLMVAASPILAAEQKPPFVQPPLQMEAAQLVPKELMAGKDYKVAPQATNDGYVNTYMLNTDWGEVTAVSDYRLRARIQEVHALKALDEMSRAGVFGDSLRNGALAPIEGLVNLVKSPIETTKGAVKGVGRWFGNIAKSVSSDDPHQEGALSAATGWAGTKRAFAVELGVDPYTDWQPLSDALASVGRAAFAGGITASVAMGAATRDTALQYPVMGLGLSKSMNQVLKDNPPERITEINRNEMAKLGLGAEAIDGFLRNYNYTPMEKLQVVDALKRMKGAKGLEALVIQAGTAPDKEVAHYMQQRAMMMGNFHAKVAPADLIPLAEVPVQKTADGRLVGVFPLDYVAWTADLDVIIRDMTGDAAVLSGVTSKEIWLEGSISPDAREAAEALGWTVRERVGLLTGEPLQVVKG